MCTLTYVKYEDKFVVTSNRDEQVHRSDVILVSEDKYNYLKDPEKGGSWFAFSDEKVLVLLNGAFERHERKLPYAKSRGIILLECMESPDSTKYLEETSFENIEPFTLVNLSFDEIIEFRWDGEDKYFSIKDTSQPHIWSSATLYNDEAREMRRSLFAESEKKEARDLWRFHTTPSDDIRNGIVMERPEINLKTLSTSQLRIIEGMSFPLFFHENHINGEKIAYPHE